ncbi:ChaN family lipoprotein [Cupriavidus sp. SZY C1]|uniref:ChaN family lipoprotein n=1 Tax=Cupriavidus sp. SZY C1 TaxID=3055037 RepID=UPI0028B56497|nr:ChaN family lipoprotein [Cupriavidus sp. SZY C1]MDT6962292.1 ChaN family lipoprotein [Cupriavidus sp. SZY C1]
MMRFLNVPAAVAALVMVAGCASTQPSPDAASRQFAGKSYVLLGEVHDNADGQQQRLQALTRAVAAGWRPAIAMEQFDRERQPDIDRARRERPRDADYLIAQAAGGKSGWDWTLYRPVVALALQYDLPLLAANLSRADASRIVRGGMGDVFARDQQTALGLDRALPADIAAAQTAALDAGHCGHFPKAMLPGMLDAQAARDAVMAQTLRPYASRGAVLIAGNGHVRRDIGVPRWLPDTGNGVLSIGYLEPDSPATGFDTVVRVPAKQREDPCKDAVMGKPMAR